MERFIRPGVLACGFCLLMAGGVAFAASGRAIRSTKSKNDGAMILTLEEESIGSQDLVAPSPAASPTPGAAGESEQPGNAGSDSNPNPAGWATVKGAAPTPGASGTPSPGTTESSATSLQPTAAPTDVPPAMDIGSLTPTRAVSDSSLKPMIEKAPNPALAASLRITEKARVSISEGQVDDAIRDLAYAVSIDPSNPYAYFFLGRAYSAKKNYAQAITFFKRAETGLGKTPAWLGETYALEGVDYEESGKQAEAAAAYQKALTATPGNLTARVGLTRLSAYIPSAPANAPETDAAQPPPTESEIPSAPNMPSPPPAPPPLPGSGND